MQISSKTIARILFALGKKEDGEKRIESFLRLIQEKNLEYLLKKVPQQLRKIAKNESKLHEAYVRTRFPLHQKEEERIRALVGGATGDIKKKEGDDTLLGGFIAQGEGKVYDASLASRIQSLETLLKS